MACNLETLKEKLNLNDIKGKKIILYFYPKDNTKGCTLEAIEFSSLKEEFEKQNAIVIGVSKDSLESHKKFKEKNNLNLDLISDESLEILKYFDVWKLKKMCGKEYMGTVRSTFILDDKLNILKEFRNVKAKGHANFILQTLKEM
ncbi:antioxidant, AhpC/TSA family [Tissierellia bacterium KA00581]|nr:antioxidant, AhpC/TSA family [Tissierellia bacterium KA00581]